ncbi:MAG: YggT family protein [Gemmatimonadetes bacterium]|nr:YggT family protein [Gemmatimonadota bacterium]
MQPLLGVFDFSLALIRRGFFAVAVAVAVVCGIDWLVRTRRIGPFSLPSSAPWWGLVFVVLAGVVVISLLEFMRDQLAYVAAASAEGPRGAYHVLVAWSFLVLRAAIVVRVLSSWIRIRPSSWLLRWSYRLTEPFLAPLRSIVPSLGMMDLTPMIAWFALGLIEGLLHRAV